jgi:hypothetical protein
MIAVLCRDTRGRDLRELEASPATTGAFAAD